MVHHHVNILNRTIFTGLCSHMNNVIAHFFHFSAIETNEAYGFSSRFPGKLHRADHVGAVPACRNRHQYIAGIEQFRQLHGKYPVESIVITDSAEEGHVVGEAQCLKTGCLCLPADFAQILGKV